MRAKITHEAMLDKKFDCFIRVYLFCHHFNNIFKMDIKSLCQSKGY